MDAGISRGEHEEFLRRIEAEHKRLSDEDRRQNRRIDLLEESTKQIGALTASVEKLALSIETMVKEQEKQGHEQEEYEKRLKALENRDGEMWRSVTGYIVTAVIGIIIGFAFKRKRSIQITSMTEKSLSSSKMSSGLDFTIWTALFLSLLKIKRVRAERGNEHV